MQVSRKLIAALAVAAAGLVLAVWLGPSAGHAGGSGAASEKGRHAVTDEKEGTGAVTQEGVERQEAGAEDRQRQAEPDARSDDQGKRPAAAAGALTEQRAMATKEVQQALQTLRELEVRKAELALARAQAHYERAVQLKETGKISAVDLRRQRSDLERAALEVERAKAEAALKGPADGRVARRAQDTLRELKVRAVELDLEDARQRYKALLELNKKGAVSSEQFLAAKHAVERAVLEVDRAKAMATLDRLQAEGAATAVATALGTRTPSIPPPVRKEALRYDGKTFDEWRTEWRTELMPERRKKAILAFKTFAAHGYAREAAQAIVEVMRNYDTYSIDKSPEGVLKQAAVDSFQSIDPQHAVAVLINELAAGNVNGRLFAARVLSNYGRKTEATKAALPALIERIHDEDWRVQQLAIVAVAQIDRLAEGFLPALRKALKNENAAVVQAAIDALVPRRVGMGSGRRWGQMRMPGRPGMRMVGRRGEGQRGPSGTYVPELVEALQHAHPDIRNRALEALQTLGPQAKEAVPALMAELKAEQEPEWLFALIAILGSIGPAASEAAPALKEIVKETKDAALRKAANAALRAITLTTDAALEDGRSGFNGEEKFEGLFEEERDESSKEGSLEEGGASRKQTRVPGTLA